MMPVMTAKTKYTGAIMLHNSITSFNSALGNHRLYKKEKKPESDLSQNKSATVVKDNKFIVC